MKEPWYCGVDGEQYGPYTWDQMLAMAAEGRLVPETFVRRESDRQWYSAAQVPGLLGRKAPVAALASSPAVANSPTLATSPARGASPQPASASSSSIAVGTAVAPATSLAEPPVIVVAPPQTAARSTPAVRSATPAAVMAPQAAAEAPAHDASPPKSPWLLVGILAATAVVVLLMGGGIVAAVWWQRADVPVAAAEGEAEEVPESDDEANPEGEQGEAGERPSATENASKRAPDQSARSPALSSRDVAAAKKTIAQQGRWTDAQRFGRYRAGTVDLFLEGIWLATDASGTWVEPVLPDRANTAAEGTGGAKYIFVELRLFNSGTVPQKFASWNEAGPADIVLAQEDGSILPLVPVAQTPDARRQAETRILPGEAIHDLVVFEAPAAPFEKLKLVLAKSALADSLKGHLALEVPVEYLFRRPSGSSAPRAVRAPITARQLPTDPGGTGLSEPPAITANDPAAAPMNQPAMDPRDQPAPVAAAAKKKSPPSKEELNKLFEEFDKPAATDATAPDE